MVPARPRARPAPIALALLLMLAACQANLPEDQEEETSKPPATVASTTQISPSSPVGESGRPTREQLRAVRVRLERVAYMTSPISLAIRPGDEGLYIAQRQGTVRVIRGSTVRELVLDLSSEVSLQGQQGLQSIAFSPDGSRLYASFNDLDGALRIDEFRMRGTRTDPASRRNVIEIAMPSSLHQGGGILFGPDGFLWLGTGDGTEGKDLPDLAQSLDKLQGKFLRIDPRPSGGRPYRIPPDNPFLEMPDARPEVFAYGLRNPWRFSFDRETGDLWLGDVGQYKVEEIDFVPSDLVPGANFGWNRLEGTHPFMGTPPRRHVPPAFEYLHTKGRCAVIGGYVYRGDRIDGLHGAYLYADFCDGHIRALVEHEGQVFGRDLGIELETITSFGEGPDGELYVLSAVQGVFRLAPI